MTSPAHSPAAFHFRPACPLDPELPPVRRLVYICSCCRREFVAWRLHCDCHPSALLHAQEVTEERYRQLCPSP
jgi:hypothetical protein